MKMGSRGGGRRGSTGAIARTPVPTTWWRRRVVDAQRSIRARSWSLTSASSRHERAEGGQLELRVCPYTESAVREKKLKDVLQCLSRRGSCGDADDTVTRRQQDLRREGDYRG